MLSGTIGFAVALALCAAVNQLPMPARFQGMVVTWTAGLAAVALLALVGVVTSTYPARRAAQMQPVDALRFES
jgi:putative ABC transport system permease protein